ncbi:uncharacterized protein LOC143461696 [Clavelina lepadiformis]|uniref:uncharacterized protein LOC143461696 n=1 Tax=Clavelina lepadiformis TaxID=159417 RepID=UPI00404215F7
MKEKVDIKNSLSNQLTPKLGAKSLKRRRPRLTGKDSEVERSAQELLNALRGELPSELKGFEPLPAIQPQCGADENVDNFNKKKKEKYSNNNDVTMIDVSLTGYTDVEKKNPLFASGRRRNTLISANTMGEDEIEDEEEKGNRGSRRKINGREFSSFGDFSEEFENKKKNFTRRSKRREPQIDATSSSCTLEESKDVLEDEEVSLTPPRKRLDPSNSTMDTPIRNLSLRDTSSDFPSSNPRRKERRNRRTSILDEESQMTGTSSDCLKIPHHNNSLDDPHNLRRRRPRRSRRPTLGATSESAIDCGVSDVTSVFSDDLNETYDPTFGDVTARRKDSKCSISGNLVDSNDFMEDLDNTAGIFTSPKRHKKRSQRRLTEHENEDADDLFSSANQRSLSRMSKYGSNDVNKHDSSFSNDVMTNYARRRCSKYLPPLSENSTKFS